MNNNTAFLDKPTMNATDTISTERRVTAAAACVPTAPAIARTPMRPHPWFGLWRGCLAAVMPGLRFFWNAASPAPWVFAAQRRRRALLLVVALIAAAAGALLAAGAPADAGWTWFAYSAIAVLMLTWIGVGLVTASMGAMVLLRGDRHALALADAHVPIDAHARTAIIMPICNEDITTVFAGLRATCESLAATGALKLFDFYLLSDSSDPDVRAAELRAWERLRTMLGDGEIGADAHIFYRRRKVRRKRKAGNVADFCRRWGANYRYMVVLDADSTMHGDTLVQLVRLMEAHPRAGIVQTLPQAYGHDTLHARVQQFASRVTGRLFALGMAYWQLGEAHYWGHNAIIRVEPFMRHCALAKIEGRGALKGEILSHDFVEAALMRRAGYEVWLAPQLEGSWEQLPPNLLDELQRDRRWCQGNLQNGQLIAEPGWRLAHRTMFAVGALSYVMAPVWLVFIALGVAAGSVQSGAAWGLWVLTLGLLLLPRALGVAAVWLRGEAADYGGRARLLLSAAVEMVVAALQAPVRMLAHSAFVIGTLTGIKLEWKSPPRDAQAIGWGEALRRLGMLAVPVALLAALALPSDAVAAPHFLPLVAALVLAVPLAVLSSHPSFGATLRSLRMLWVPEERRPPRTLQRAIEQRGFADLVPLRSDEPKVYARTRTWGGPRVGAAFATVATACAVALTPKYAVTPEVPISLDPPVEMASAPSVELPSLMLVNDAPAKRQRTVRDVRPARMIDDAVRQRAFDAVQRSLADDEPSDSV
jgi:membrane glycosyltransferase